MGQEPSVQVSFDPRRSSETVSSLFDCGGYFVHVLGCDFTGDHFDERTFDIYSCSR